MKKIGAFILSISFLFAGAIASSVPATAGEEKHTQAEAMALVKKAVAYLNTNGKEKAFAEFSRKDGPFVNGNLYIFVYDMSGTQWANGYNPKMVGKNLLEMKDADGKFIVKAFIETANTKKSGWVDYKWPNPSTGTVDDKSSYIEKDGDVLVAAGIYK